LEELDVSNDSKTERGELVLYRSEDGTSRLYLRVSQGTVWLTQLELAQLFQTTKQNISLHASNVLKGGELVADQVVKTDLTTAADGKKYRTRRYNLDMILAIGYRVRSPRGTQFRQWATTHLREFLVKGFVLDDTRLKEPGGWDYFDELLARIRDIYATAVDYDGKSEAAQLFFKKVQNKMLWAVTGQTAPELIATRADPAAPNMGLTTWTGGRVRKQDVTVAKNYLSQDEIEALDRIVVMYLDYAEDQAQRRRTLTMDDWEDKLDAFLKFNEREVLTHAGKLRADVAEKLALERYESFDAARREAALLAADVEDMAALEQAERALEDKARRKKK
jgi:hypothetical protein